MGLWLGLVFVKFGNPVIFGELIERPGNFVEFLLNPWPLSWGYLMVGLVLLFGVPVWQRKPAVPKWALILPLVWLGWQFLSARLSINGSLTQQVLPSFTACIVCYYLGLFSLSHFEQQAPLWVGLLLGLLFCLWIGLGQHFGGLEETRRYLENIHWELYPPEMKEKLTSPEFQQKISSNRIFGTFVYPNALAGGILLAFPPAIQGLWNYCGRFPFLVRGVLVGTVAYLALAALFWSGSKAGWLIAIGMVVVCLLSLEQLSRRWRIIGIVILLGGGLTGFFGKYSAYFAKKNNSASARLDYWRAAGQMIREKPLFGSGPGTFLLGYKRIKSPESESSKLAHNDYLQQGSDSGVVGLGSYAALVIGSVIVLYRRLRRNRNPLAFAVWLGVAGLATQEMVEFSLYIPALAWPFFLLTGWLWGFSGGLGNSAPSSGRGGINEHGDDHANNRNRTPLPAKPKVHRCVPQQA